MKIYLAGPMRGYPQFNFPAFHAAAAKLRKEGYEVWSPAENDEKTLGKDFATSNKTGDEAQASQVGFSLREALAADTRFICLEADGIALLPGWEKSKGATAEHALALALGHKVLILGDEYASN